MAKTLYWNNSYTANALKCNVLQIQHHHMICVALRGWNKTWGMFLPSTWGLRKSWRNKASSCLNVWALPEMLFRIFKVMTFRVSVNSNTNISAHLYCLWIFAPPNTFNESHSLITCTYTYIQSYGKVTWRLDYEPSSLLFNLLLSFPSFFTICLFLHLSLLHHKTSRVVTVGIWCSVQRLSILPLPRPLLQEKLLSAGTVRSCVLCVTCTPWWQASRRACGSYPLSFI